MALVKGFAALRLGQKSFRFGFGFFLIGSLFPVSAWFFREDPLFLFSMICSAPFIMGAIAALAGHGFDRLSSLRLASSDEQLELLALRKVVEASRLGSWKWNVEQSEVHCDERWFEIFGLPHSKSNVFSLWEGRVHPSDRAEVQSQYAALFEGSRDRIEVINRLLCQDGTWIWTLNQTWVAERAPSGRPLHLFGTVVDVTEHIQREHLSNEIQKFANIGGWELDLVTQKTRWTDQTYVIHGIPKGTPTEKLWGFRFTPPMNRKGSASASRRQFKAKR